jgi:hypothetical protein
MENKKHEWFRLNQKAAKGILVYLLIIGIASLLLLVSMLIDEINPVKNLKVFSRSIVFSVVTSLMGSSIFYSRKMYKACINLDMVEPKVDTDRIRQTGVMYYYFSRPIYAACLGVIACVALRSGTEFITKDGGINENFQFLVLIISFFVGYSSGDFIDYLEVKGKQVVQGVFNNDTND